MFKILVLLALLTSPRPFGSSSASWAAEKAIPKPPQYYVLDEPHLLNPKATRALEALLIEHDRTTGEQVVVAIFKSLDGADLNEYTNLVFQKWGIGQRGKDNGVLFAIFNDDHKARIEVGYGLEPLLTDAKSSRILHDVLVPAMQQKLPDEGVTQSALEILRAIDSPLLQDGQAERILHSGGMLRRQIQPNNMPNAWPVWFFLGAVLLFLVSNIMNSAEAHFTSAGWYRPRPWRKRWDDAGRGGGFFGGFGGGLGGGGGGGWGGGDGGGFSGGGGSSGGGGASAGW